VKKLAAIFLIALLLFNWYGYRFVTNYLQQKADHQLESRIDAKEYDESQLIEIRVAMNMPYQNNQAEFERHYGEIEVGGNIYTYVKRRIEDGFLVLKCLPNKAKQDLKSADNLLFNANNGLDQEHSNGKSGAPLNNIVKVSLSDYDDYSFRFSIHSIESPGKGYGSSPSFALYSVFLPVSAQPPEA
jgi:hypothetical protein